MSQAGHQSGSRRRGRRRLPIYNGATDWLREERSAQSIRFPKRPPAILLFPAPYSVGISNLGFLRIWEILNSIPNFACDRAFFAPHDEQAGAGLETRLPLNAFPLVLISSSFELDLEAVIETLVSARIEPRREKRKETDPLVIAGGLSLTLNPAPWGPVLDLAILGEGEISIREWIKVYQEWVNQRSPKKELIEASEKIPYVWIPDRSERSVYPATYPAYTDDPATSPALHPRGHFGDCWLVEVTRGCPRKCLFCSVCAAYSARFAELEVVLQKMRDSGCLGAKKVGLVGGAVGDHPALKMLVHRIIDSDQQVTVSSLRIERCDPELIELLAQGGSETLTVAPETGAETLRRRIGKRATNDDLAAFVRSAHQFGIRTVRLYFLIGLPEPEEPAEIVKLVKLLRKEVPTSLKLDLSISSFIPKPGTPWEQAPFAATHYLDQVKQTLRRALREVAGISVKFEPSSFERRAALFSRGDARLGEALVQAILNRRSWEQELRLAKIDLREILHPTPRDRQDLPWGFIQV